jgi:nicotinamidase-related amidase
MSRTSERLNADLHGNAPDKSSVALLLIDVVNDLDFPEGSQLLGHALPMAERLATLKTRAKEVGIPAIYVNDNFGRWRSDFASLVRHCVEGDGRGRPIVERLRPERDDYFVLKPKHSGFYCTSLELLLRYIGADTLILTGLAANLCVLFTAHDAYQRDLRLFVPADCVASNTAALNDEALEKMRSVLKADTRPSGELELSSFQEQR